MAQVELKKVNSITCHGESQAIPQSSCLFSRELSLIYSVKVGDMLIWINIHKCGVQFHLS